ncbi:galactosyldiacylglycerol synthase [Candidatus Binatia bacterium]|nr:galactosyldiacylglycerol synthase [Candidatus Binatia bacterium]
MIELRDKESGSTLGTISDQQLEFLRDQLEEESPEDDDYYIDRATLDMLEEQGADRDLLDLLKRALGGREDMEIQWSRQ